MDSSCVNVCQWVTHNTKVIKKSDLFNNFGADMDHWVRQTVVGLQVAELCIWVSWLQPGGRITEIWRTRVKYAVEKLQRPQPDFLWISFSVSSPTPRVPLTKFRSIRRELTDSGRKVEELLADTPSLKYNFGFPASGAPTPETLKNYLDVSSSRTCFFPGYLLNVGECHETGDMGIFDHMSADSPRRQLTKQPFVCRTCEIVSCYCQF